MRYINLSFAAAMFFPSSLHSFFIPYVVLVCVIFPLVSSSENDIADEKDLNLNFSERPIRAFSDEDLSFYDGSFVRPFVSQIYQQMLSMISRKLLSVSLTVKEFHYMAVLESNSSQVLFASTFISPLQIRSLSSGMSGHVTVTTTRVRDRVNNDQIMQGP